jgi:hypothetical protein
VGTRYIVTYAILSRFVLIHLLVSSAPRDTSGVCVLNESKL